MPAKNTIADWAGGPSRYLDLEGWRRSSHSYRARRVASGAVSELRKSSARTLGSGRQLIRSGQRSLEASKAILPIPPATANAPARDQRLWPSLPRPGAKARPQNAVAM